MNKIKSITYWVQRGYKYRDIANRLMLHPSTIRNAVQSDRYLRERYEREQAIRSRPTNQTKLF